MFRLSSATIIVKSRPFQHHLSPVLDAPNWRSKCPEGYFDSNKSLIYVVNGTVDQIVNQAVEKYKNHDSILRIKEKTKNFPSFGFTHANPLEVSEQIDALNTKKASRGGIPSKVLKMPKKAIYPYLTDCINTSINDCVFPEELKAATNSPDFNNKESYLKSNYRPISVLPSVSKHL